jgi:hypothetical protein
MTEATYLWFVFSEGYLKTVHNIVYPCVLEIYVDLIATNMIMFTCSFLSKEVLFVI